MKNLFFVFAFLFSLSVFAGSETISFGFSDFGASPNGQRAYSSDKTITWPTTKTRLEFSYTGGTLNNSGITVHIHSSAGNDGGRYTLNYNGSVTRLWSDDGNISGTILGLRVMMDWYQNHPEFPGLFPIVVTYKWCPDTSECSSATCPTCNASYCSAHTSHTCQCPNTPQCVRFTCQVCNEVICTFHHQHFSSQINCVNGKYHHGCFDTQAAVDAFDASLATKTCPICGIGYCPSPICGHNCIHDPECTFLFCRVCSEKYCTTHGVFPMYTNCSVCHQEMCNHQPHTCPNGGCNPNCQGGVVCDGCSSRCANGCDKCGMAPQCTGTCQGGKFCDACARCNALGCDSCGNVPATCAGCRGGTACDGCTRCTPTCDHCGNAPNGGCGQAGCQGGRVCDGCAACQQNGCDHCGTVPPAGACNSSCKAGTACDNCSKCKTSGCDCCGSADSPTGACIDSCKGGATCDNCQKCKNNGCDRCGNVGVCVESCKGGTTCDNCLKCQTSGCDRCGNPVTPGSCVESCKGGTACDHCDRCKVMCDQCGNHPGYTCVQSCGHGNTCDQCDKCKSSGCDLCGESHDGVPCSTSCKAGNACDNCDKCKGESGCDLCGTADPPPCPTGCKGGRVCDGCDKCKNGCDKCGTDNCNDSCVGGTACDHCEKCNSLGCDGCGSVPDVEGVEESEMPIWHSAALDSICSKLIPDFGSGSGRTDWMVHIPLPLNLSFDWNLNSPSFSPYQNFLHSLFTFIIALFFVVKVFLSLRQW